MEGSKGGKWKNTDGNVNFACGKRSLFSIRMNQSETLTYTIKTRLNFKLKMHFNIL